MPSGGTGQPTKRPRQKPGHSKLHKKTTVRARGRRPSVAELQERLNALTKELSEAREQQTATADVLKTISNSPDKLELVFEPLLSNATRLCNAKFGILSLYDGEVFHRVAAHNVPPAFAEGYLHEVIQLHPESGLAQMLRTKRVEQIADYKAEAPYREGDPTAVKLVDIGGARTLVNVPLLKEDVLVGAIAIYRQEVEPFTDRQLQLLENFATQAVIAIENVRLFEAEQERTRELTELLQQQTATADVLKTISQSTFDLQKVLDALVASAASLCQADKTMVYRREGDNYHLAASYGFTDEFRQFAISHPHVTGRGTAVGRMSLEGRTIHIPDVSSDPEYTFRQGQSLGNFRTVLAVPMLRQGTPIGALVLIRAEPRPFTDKQIELVTTFADQAVIAIENTRLLNELTESLQQQTATADVLKVISRSAFDLQAVLDTLIKSAVQLCKADIGLIARPNEAGLFQTQAHFGFSPELKEELERIPFRPGRGSVTSRALL